jgi:hypothetical protein
MEDTGQNQTNTGSPDAEPMKNPPEDLRYAAERPISVAVFGVLSFVLGGYPFINTYPRLYKVIEPALTGKVSVPGTPWFLLSCLISVGLSIWLLILGIGLLRMTKWARRGSVAYAWVSIGLYVLNLGSTIVMVLSGLMKLPIGSRSFWIVYIHAALIGLIYPLLLLIFMKTEKVKRAFGAIGG